MGPGCAYHRPRFQRNPVPPFTSAVPADDSLFASAPKGGRLHDTANQVTSVNPLLRNMRFNPEDLISQSTAAQIRGITKQSISRLIQRGSLNTIDIDGHTFLFRSEVEKFKPSKGGRPKAKAETRTKAVGTTTRKARKS